MEDVALGSGWISYIDRCVAPSAGIWCGVSFPAVDTPNNGHRLYGFRRLIQVFVARSVTPMTEQQSHLSVAERDDIHIVEFSDRKILEEMSIAEIGDELSALVSGNANIKMLLSFRNVEHLSSAALGMLIKLHKQVKDGSGQLRLTEINPQIYEVFKITRLNKLFDIRTSREDALESF